jgi:SAM-dependent methyltransferase
MSLDDPAVVRAQYATETGLETRRSIYENAEGDDAREVAFQAIAAAHPRRLLEVGAGPGELSARIMAELGAEVIALDISERMVDLARGRGVDARVGDIQALPFADASFDTAVAAWMLYHVPDLGRGLAEIARVLAPGGQLVAVTNSELHLEEARVHAGVTMVGRLPFNRDNGREILERHFATVERIDVDGWVTFPDAEAIRRYVRSMISIAEEASADRVPDDVGPVRAGVRVSVFVARVFMSGTKGDAPCALLERDR